MPREPGSPLSSAGHQQYAVTKSLGGPNDIRYNEEHSKQELRLVERERIKMHWQLLMLSGYNHILKFTISKRFFAAKLFIVQSNCAHPEMLL